MVKKNKGEVVQAEPEIIETEPLTGGPSKEIAKQEQMGIDTKYLAHLDYVANNIDRFVAAKQKIWQAILRIAKAGDWVVFESADSNAPNGKRSSVCLSGAGADRIAASIGISFTNWEEKKEEGDDEKGRWYRYWFEVDASFGGRVVKAMGRAGSRDKFFGKVRGELREISDIDESNVRMAAFHNAMKEGVKILLGLRNIPITEFEKAGIQLSYARRYEFKKPDRPNPLGSTQHQAPSEQDQLITEPQRRRFWAIANKSKVPHQAIKDHLQKLYGIEETDKIKKEFYDDICHWLENWKPGQ